MMPTSPSHEPWLSIYNGCEQPADRQRKTSDDNTAELPTAISGGRQLRYKGNNKEVDLGALLPTAKVDSCTNGEFAK